MAFSFRACLAAVLQCVRLCGLASAGGNSSRGLHSGAGGLGVGLLGCAQGGVCGPLWGRRAAGRGAPLGRCVRVVEWGGVVKGVRRVGVWRACAGLQAGGGGPCRGARG